MDEGRNQLVTAAVAAVLIGAGFYGYEYFQKRHEPAPAAEQVHHAAPASHPSASAAKKPSEKAPSQKGSSPARLAKQRKIHIETNRFDAVFTNLDTGLESFTLKGKRFVENSHPHQMVTTDKAPYLPLRPTIRGVRIPNDAVWKVEEATDKSARFSWSGDGVHLVRTIQAGKGPYQLWLTLTITNEGSVKRAVRPVITTHRYTLKSKEGSHHFPFEHINTKVTQGICRYDDETVRQPNKKLLHGMGFGAKVHFVGLEDTYFATLLAPDSSEGQRCQLESSLRGGTVKHPQGTLTEARLLYPRAELAPGASKTWRTLAYVGPKEHDWLKAAGHQLPEAVDFGWFTWIARVLVGLLRWIHGLVGNWGIAIILLTVMVKALLYPLTEKSFQSMAKMRRLKPEMDRVNELYADDREKKGMAVMELYRKNKINPVAGCLPMILQMPIWFALYRALSMNVELYHAPFALWLQDLSAPDPYYVLPLGLGLLMFVQQRLTPTTMDATQAKLMMYFMPVMMTVFMLFLPAGLCLYMVTNSGLGIGQQKWIQVRLDRQDAVAATAPEDPSAGSGGEKEATSKAAKSPPGAKARGGKRRQRRGRA